VRWFDLYPKVFAVMVTAYTIRVAHRSENMPKDGKPTCEACGNKIYNNGDGL